MCEPSPSVGSESPLLHANAVPPSIWHIVEPGLASVRVNESCGVLSEITLESAGAVVATTGAVVSTVKLTTVDESLSFPPLSVAVAVNS